MERDFHILYFQEFLATNYTNPDEIKKYFTGQAKTNKEIN